MYTVPCTLYVFCARRSAGKKGAARGEGGGGEGDMTNIDSPEDCQRYICFSPQTQMIYEVCSVARVVQI